MRPLACIAVALSLLCVLPTQADAATSEGLTGADLVAADNGLEGATVTFEGEVVSEALAGGEGHVWLNVSSGGVAVGVWMPEDMAEAIGSFGAWSRTGDIVRVTGVLNNACDIHGGDLDVHAATVEVITPGVPREHQVQYWKLVIGVAGLIGAYVIIRIARRREERPA